MKDDCSVKVNLVDSKENKGSKLADKSVRAYLDVEKAKKMLGGGGGSSKLRVKIKVDYVPTNPSELANTSHTGVSGYIYNAPTGVSLENADGDLVSIDDFVAAAKAGELEIISVDHFGAFVTKVDDNTVTLQDNPTLVTSKLSSSIVASKIGEQDSVMISGIFWGLELCLPYAVVAYNTDGQQSLVAFVGVVYEQ